MIFDIDLWFLRGGGVLRFGLDGCAGRASKPLPIFKAENGTHKDFSWKIGPFFTNFVMGSENYTHV